MMNQKDRFSIRVSIPMVKHESSVTAPKKDPLRYYKYTGLYFGKRSPTENNIKFWFRVFRSLFLTISCFLLFSAIFYHTLVNVKFTMKYASYHLATNWFFQACLNVVLIQYWQFNHQWNKDMLTILYSPCTERLFKQNRYLMVPLCALIVAFLFCLLIASSYRDEYTTIFNFNHIFGSKILVLGGRLLSWYTAIVFLTVNFYFVTVTGIVRNELRDFNKRFEKEMSLNRLCTNSSCQEVPDLFSTLHSFYLEHLRISNKIRGLDRTLNVFAFTTAVTTIPATVFGLWTFIVRLQSSWIHILVTLVELFLCMIALLFLVINPARIKEELLETRSLIFSSVSAWEQFDSRICDIGRLFVAHLDDDNLGLSIWGFIQVNKHFIMSIVSITLTFLVFLLETQNGSKTLIAGHRTIPKLKP